MNKKNTSLVKIIASNRQARFHYEILETYDAGLVLLGTEVKSLRNGNISLQEGYIEDDNNEIYLTNVHIAEYSFFAKSSHDPIRKRKLLLHRKEINKIIEKVKVKGVTIVPLKMYFNKKGIAKLEIALAKGKKLHDKRSVLKERAAKKEADLALKNFKSKVL